MIDILGFLAFEVVRELCEGALRIKQQLEEQAERRKRNQGREDRLQHGSGRGRASHNERKGAKNDAKGSSDDHVMSGESGLNGSSSNAPHSTSPHKRKTLHSTSDIKGSNGPTVGVAFPPNKRRAPAGGVVASASASTLSLSESAGGRASSPYKQLASSPARADTDEPCTLFTMPAIKTSGLDLAHIQEAFACLQRRRPALGVGGGGLSGGLRRTKYRII